ncbi:MerR family transcriptional regulator [Williamsia sp.]|uniref:MerR family transcriptional regulator n=1 Tax=Williamsia sp. TaxID=1872085 RepID=UPI002F9465ED
MRIGEFAKQTETTARSLRYYEARGLLTAPRDGSGYRVYGEAELRVLQQIQALKDFGFDLEETRPFVECLRAGYPTGGACAESAEVYRRKLIEIDDCIAQLENVRAQIRQQLAEHSANTPAGESDDTVAAGPACQFSTHIDRPSEGAQSHGS